ncbi:MAG: sugar phosphate isomerase/epimerase [Candidatus Bathyarchaeia archaeon]
MCWLYAITKYRYVPSLDEILLAINDAARMGFRYMELEGVGPQLYTVAKNKSIIKKRCEENEIKMINFVPVLPDIMSLNIGKRRKALKDFKIGCELGSFFETDMIQIDTFHLPIYLKPVYDISEEFRYAYNAPKLRVDPKFDFWEYFNNVLIPSISECNDMAKDHSLKLCIEPRTWENVPNVWALELVMREVDSKNLGAILDTAHLAAQKMEIVQCIEMLGKRIFYVHASDSDFLTEDHLEIGKGSIDWVSMLKALKKHRYQGYIGIDVGGRAEMRGKLDVMYINSKRYLEELMPKVAKMSVWEPHKENEENC